MTQTSIPLLTERLETVIETYVRSATQPGNGLFQLKLEVEDILEDRNACRVAWVDGEQTTARRPQCRARQAAGGRRYRPRDTGFQDTIDAIRKPHGDIARLGSHEADVGLPNSHPYGCASGVGHKANHIALV